MQLFQKQKFHAQLVHTALLARHIILPAQWVTIITIKVRLLTQHAQHVTQITIVQQEALLVNLSFLVVMDSYVTVEL